MEAAVKNKNLNLSVFLSLFLFLFSVAGISAADESAAGNEWLADSFADPATIPFSFQYDGQPSARLLPKWKSTRETKRIDDTRELRRYVFTDPATGMQARFECTVYNDFPAVEWLVYFKNGGAKTAPILEDVQALDMRLPGQGADPVLHYAKGATCSWDDYRPIRRVLNRKTVLEVEPGGGRSSSDFLPFFNLERADTSGIVIAVGWSGEWKMQFTTDSSRAAHIRGGMALTHLKLNPGEEIRTPRMALLFYRSDPVEGQNMLRRFILAYHRPLRDGAPFPMPLMCSSWGGTPASEHLSDIQGIVDTEMPVDYYWIDAEWFGKGLWHQTVGDWRVKKDLYPDGFAPISGLLHKSDRRFLLWFEPERVCDTVPWYTEHSDWLMSVPKSRRYYNLWFEPEGSSQEEPDWVIWESRRNQICDNDRLFNLGDPAARKFLTDFISDRIDEFGIDCFRHDANISPLEFWRAADAPDRQGMSEIRWVEGLYAFWDELLRRHPGLIIDNCASGGRRIDLESMSRSTPFWRTDYPNHPVAKQCHTYGLSSWVPLNSTGNVRPITEDSYLLRSTFSSSLVVELPGLAKLGPQDPKIGVTRNMLRQYRDIQPYYLGDYYPLTCYSQTADAWMAWQFNRPDLGEGMIQVFRRPQSISESGKLRLFGLDENAVYLVTNQDAPGETESTGRSLMNDGVKVTVSERPAAAVLIYKKRQ